LSIPNILRGNEIVPIVVPGGGGANGIRGTIVVNEVVLDGVRASSNTVVDVH